MMSHIKFIRSFPPPSEIFRDYFFLLNKSRLVEEKDAANLNDEQNPSLAWNIQIIM